MTTSRDAPNPLRPYYKPPSIGLPLNETITPGPNASNGGFTKPSIGAKGVAGRDLGRQARNILSDLDYGTYLPNDSPSLAEMAKKLMDQAIWNYTSVLLSQPFEVAKTVLQVHMAQSQLGGPGPVVDGRHTDNERSRNGYTRGRYNDDYIEEEDEDEDSPSYFTSTAPASGTYKQERDHDQYGMSRSNSDTPVPTPSSRPSSAKLELKRPNAVLDVLAQLWSKESAWGVWKGTNATFVYNFLLKTIESWTRSLLSALLNVPDPGLIAPGVGGLDIVDSPNPIASLAVAVMAAGVAGVVLSPLDIIRTRLIVTPTSTYPRAILPSLRSLPSMTLPPSLAPITLLYSMIPTFISASTPLVLRSTLSIDPVITPATYSVFTFLSSATELFIRLPLETVLRRGQVALLKDSAEQKSLNEQYTTFRHGHGRSGTAPEKDSDAAFKTSVDVGPYRGVWGTMWFIVNEEGIRVIGPPQPIPPPKGSKQAALHAQKQPKTRKGQGVKGLWRGWRVGFWGLVGVWGAAALSSGKGGEF